MPSASLFIPFFKLGFHYVVLSNVNLPRSSYFSTWMLRLQAHSHHTCLSRTLFQRHYFFKWGGAGRGACAYKYRCPREIRGLDPPGAGVKFLMWVLEQTSDLCRSSSLFWLLSHLFSPRNRFLCNYPFYFQIRVGCLAGVALLSEKRIIWGGEQWGANTRFLPCSPMPSRAREKNPS